MRLTEKVVRYFATPRRIAVAVIIAVLSVQLLSGTFYAMSKQVSIVDDNGTTVAISFAKSVAEVLTKEGIILGEADEIYPPLDDVLKDNQIITINRAKNITLIDGAVATTKITAKRTVGEALASFGLAFGGGVDLNVDRNDEVTENMVIQLTYSSEEIVTLSTSLPFETVERTNSSLNEGQTKTVQQGEKGILEEKYLVAYENGVEKSKTLVSSVQTVNPVDEIIERGLPRVATATKTVTAAKSAEASTGVVAYNRGGGSIVSRGNEIRYKEAITVSASAYDLSYESCGKHAGDPGYGVTASGMKAGYGVVSVDPSVIPLGTRLYIEAPDGSWVYGNAVAGDTGGAIKGNKVDLFMNTRDECFAFGRRQAVVYILE